MEKRNYTHIQGSVKSFSQIGLQASGKMKSVGNGGILNGSLQVLHVHVLLAAPLGTCHMAEPGADQHQGGVAIAELFFEKSKKSFEGF